MCSKESCEEALKLIISRNENLKKLVSSEMNLKVSCRECVKNGVEGNSRAFLFFPPFQIVLCTNRLQTKDIEEVIIHEAIHAFDFYNNRCDFKTCEGLAYTEVRAAREAECGSGIYPFKWMKDECVKYHATKSTANLFPKKQAAMCVDAVFLQAMADLTPGVDFKQLGKKS
jgi:hypothetical protein